MSKIKNQFFSEINEEPNLSKSQIWAQQRIDREKKRDELRINKNNKQRVFIVNAQRYKEQKTKAENDSVEVGGRRTDKYALMIKEHECLTFAKKLVRFPTNTIDEIEKLNVNFPHATDLLDCIKAQIYLQQHTKKTFAKLPPLLLAGEAGTGKSALAKKIAQIVAPRYYNLNLAAATESFVLTGLSMCYDSGDVVEIAKILKSWFTNNFLVIEELDKCSSF